MVRQLISNAELLDDLLKDPGFREQWERTALARAVAEAVIGYRADRGLTQTAQAKVLGRRQPGVARLEAAERNPSMETLAQLSRQRAVRGYVGVRPATGVVAKVGVRAA